jgi:ABC-type amino acid transport substrate-binding protein
MKLRLNLLLITTLLGLVSCGSAHKLSGAGMNVEVQKNKPKGCVVVGKHTGKHEGGSIDLARNMARNLAADKGANQIYFGEEFSNGGTWTVIGTSYKCP